MNDTTTSNAPEKSNWTETVRNSLMVILTLIFVFLYAAAFSGKLDPLIDNTLLTRLEPLIFVIIGYYFGRLPFRQSAQTLKEEITRQTQRADAAQYAKEKAQLERESLEEKIKNARTALKTNMPPERITEEQTKSVRAAIGILDS